MNGDRLLLQEVRTRNAWEEWVLFMLEGVAITARQTIDLIGSIRTVMLDKKHRIRSQFPRIYSQDLLNNLFLNLPRAPEADAANQIEWRFRVWRGIFC